MLHEKTQVCPHFLPAIDLSFQSVVGWTREISDVAF